MFDSISMEKLYHWQRRCLFLAVLFFPLQSLLFYSKSFFSLFSFYGQISSVPILIGFTFAIVTCFRERKEGLFFVPFLLFSCFYLLLLAGISVHSIAEYCFSDRFNVAAFGETQKIHLVKSILLQLGFSNEDVLYAILVFLRDMVPCVKEVIFAFGFSVWVAFLYRKGREEVFLIFRNAILLDVALLIPYVALEILHLFGYSEITEILRGVNSCLYESSGYPGWYPPMVSPNQIRGSWTEPAFFAMWLSFSIPFLISYFFDGVCGKGWIKAGFFFTFLWGIWLMTYARTSIVLIAMVCFLYFFFAVLSNRKEDWKRLGILFSSLALAFCFISTLGPQEVMEKAKRAATDVHLSSESKLFQNTIRSVTDAESRSNPVRLQNLQFQLEVFKDHPFVGSGDTLSTTALLRKMKQSKESLAPEVQLQLNFTEANGIFMSILNSHQLSVPGCLARRGLFGFTVMFVPILLLGGVLFWKILKTGSVLRERMICVFIACTGTFLTSLTFSSLSFLFFWGSVGIALGMVLPIRGDGGQVQC